MAASLFLPTPAMAFKVATAVPTMYSLLSLSEYFTHRIYQHADWNKNAIIQFCASLILRNQGKGHKIKGGGHVEHHAETLDDMSLRSDERWKTSPAALSLNGDPYRGTAFTWPVTFLMFLQLLITCVPVMGIMGWSPLATIGWIVPSLLAHTLVWNTIHPAMHGLQDPLFKEGPPGKLLSCYRNSKLFKFLELNHVGHHVVGGLGNYNVCCPGMDHVFGTWVPEKVWRTKVDPKFAHLY